MVSVFTIWIASDIYRRKTFNYTNLPLKNLGKSTIIRIVDFISFNDFDKNVDAAKKRIIAAAKAKAKAKAQEKAMKFHSLDNAENGIKKRT